MLSPLPRDALSTDPPSVPPASATSAPPPAPSALPEPSYRPLPPLTPSRLFSLYMTLAKSRLSILVVLTSTTGLALSPYPTTVPVLISLTVGTFLTSAAANTINQMFEHPLDAQALRTRARPLVTRAISTPHAALFALATALVGTALLYYGCNATTAALAVFTLGLYAFVYTPMKRLSVWNTWVGALVGAIPPVMGWTATGGELWPTREQKERFGLPAWLPESRKVTIKVGGRPVEEIEVPEGWATPSVKSYLAKELQRRTSHGAAEDEIPLPSIALPDAHIPTLYVAGNDDAEPREVEVTLLAPLTLAALLFAWQFPHFNALSHVLRSSYAISSYHMLSAINPKKNALVALRYALVTIPICSVMAPASGAVTGLFALTSLVPNAIFARRAWQFYRRPRDQTARRLFWDSLWWLPVILGLMMVHKNDAGWLQGVRQSAAGRWVRDSQAAVVYRDLSRWARGESRVEEARRTLELLQQERVRQDEALERAKV
jgi:protoheme IX farnesyltransferase